ncbi:MAG: MBL fold metallo-hydrolase [Victivallales bacterium]|nr:MBL fold metallo-hydrolase [Victivallales bacterium]
MAIAIAKDIFWTGYIDWNLRDFHGYTTSRGVTYNSYLVKGTEKTALIDSVKAPFASEMLMQVAQLTPPAKVDYLVVNHAELDHSGALPLLMGMMPRAKVVCNKKTQAILQAYYGCYDWNWELVATGSTLSLGDKTLQFTEVPFVHWPDSMVTYCPEVKVLFSNDAFGQHYCSIPRFDDEVPLADILAEAKTYYANIVNPYSKQVALALAKLGALDLAQICPAHGVCWRSHVAEILKAYRNWSAQKSQAKVLVIYETMWESTRMMAEAIARGASMVPGVQVKLLNARLVNKTILATECLDAAVIALGSATLNNQALSDITGDVSYLKGLNFTGKASLAFGSFGWGKGGAEQLDAELDNLKWERLASPIKAKWRPDAQCLSQCLEAGKALAEKALATATASSYEKLFID